MGDTAILFQRPKVTERCLSAWQVSQLTLGLLRGEDLAAAQHQAATCPHCQALVVAEEADRKAAMYEAVPRVLLDPPPKQRPAQAWLWRSLGAFALVSASLILVLVARNDFSDSPGSDSRLKGGIAVSVSVMRNDKLILHDVALEQVVGGLQPTDRLRLRVHGGGGLGCSPGCACRGSRTRHGQLTSRVRSRTAGGCRSGSRSHPRDRLACGCFCAAARPSEKNPPATAT
jgi:hypothetical protein